MPYDYEKCSECLLAKSARHCARQTEQYPKCFCPTGDTEWTKILFENGIYGRPILNGKPI